MSDLFCVRNFSTNSNYSSVVVINIELESVLLKYSIKNTEKALFLSYYFPLLMLF